MVKSEILNTSLLNPLLPSTPFPGADIVVISVYLMYVFYILYYFMLSVLT